MLGTHHKIRGWVEDTTHHRTKTVQSTIFGPHVCGLTHFENLLSVYPALDNAAKLNNNYFAFL